MSDVPTERVSVMIVDDQPPFRAAARAVVDRVAGFELVAEVASGEEAVATSGELGPQLVLMDINMGELNGIEATRLITQSNPGTKVILVSTYTLDDLPPDARTSGAVAYVNKDELSPRMIRRLWEAGGDPAWLASRLRVHIQQRLCDQLLGANNYSVLRSAAARATPGPPGGDRGGHVGATTMTAIPAAEGDRSATPDRRPRPCCRRTP